MYDWNFTIVADYADVLARGAYHTVVLTVISNAVGSSGGLILVGLEISNIPVLRYLSRIYIEVFLALPVLVILFWLYYCLPMIGVRLTPGEAAVAGLSMSLSAFFAEVVRGSINSIPTSMVETATVFGFSKREIFTRILLPIVARTAFPAVFGLYVTTFKFSTLASAISFNDLLHSADNIIAATYRPLELYTSVAIVFLIIIWPLSCLARYFESKQRWRI